MHTQTLQPLAYITPLCIVSLLIPYWVSVEMLAGIDWKSFVHVCKRHSYIFARTRPPSAYINSLPTAPHNVSAPYSLFVENIAAIDWKTFTRVCTRLFYVCAQTPWPVGYITPVDHHVPDLLSYSVLLGNAWEILRQSIESIVHDYARHFNVCTEKLKWNKSLVYVANHFWIL